MMDLEKPRMSRRASRVSHMMQKELGVLISQNIRDPRLGFATVVKVVCANNLKYAKIYVSIMGTDKVKKSTMIGLNSAKGYLRVRLSALMKLRYMPDIEFAIDDSLDYSLHMEKIFSDLERERNNTESEK